MKVMSRFLASASVLALLAGTTFVQGERIYEVNKTSNAPTIDGIKTSESEWGDAAAATADWVRIRGQGDDDTNNRFQAVYDDSGLYILHEVDYDQWQPDRGFGSIDFGYENINFYFDPNTDGETNDQLGADDTGIDGYQIAFNQPEGNSVYSEDDPDLGIFQEAHVNALFGNQGAHEGFFGLQINQTTSNEEEFGYLEMYIPWEDFNASDPDFFDPEFDDIGLFHPFAPADGDEWFFNVSRIESSGKLPAWSQDPSSNFFASRPHGVLAFSEGGGGGAACDINGDGECTGADIDAMGAAIAAGATDAKYDVNGDGSVNLADHEFLIEAAAPMFNTYYGDSNMDGEFNSTDFVFVFTAGQYEDGIAGNSSWVTGDWNSDTEFDSSDFVRAFTRGGYELGPRAAVAAVPEPSSLVLLLVGLLPFIRRRR